MKLIQKASKIMAKFCFTENMNIKLVKNYWFKTINIANFHLWVLVADESLKQTKILFTCLMRADCLFCLLSWTRPSTAWYRMFSAELSVNKSSPCPTTRCLMAERRMVESEVSKMTFRVGFPRPEIVLTYLGSVCHPFRRIFSRSGKSKLGPAFRKRIYQN